MKSLLSMVFGQREESRSNPLEMPENPLLRKLKGIAPAALEDRETQRVQTEKARFLGELEEVRQITEGLEDKLVKAANKGQTYLDVYSANRPLSGAIRNYLERAGFRPVVVVAWDQLGEYELIQVQWGEEE